MDNTHSPLYYWLTTIALVFALGVVLLGAYTRLSDAGLGCPDWPGCYGKLILPKTFPNHPVITTKAWTEMTHRYAAGILGFLMIVLTTWNFIRHRKNSAYSLLTPTLLVGVLIFQIVLGMWTVTAKVHPTIVMGHLIGGMMIVALLSWLRLNAKPQRITDTKNYSSIKSWVIFGLILLGLQMLLGAWTSTNYAALACPSFPFCHGSLFPPLLLSKAFNLLLPIGPNYEGGHLAMEARVTIQMMHRYGAFITAAFWLPFSVYLVINKMYRRLRPWGWILLTLLTTQCLLGILNVVAQLPITVAVSHNGVAALFLIAVITLLHKLMPRRRGLSP